jgi:hypothetical protein
VGQEEGCGKALAISATHSSGHLPCTSETAHTFSEKDVALLLTLCLFSSVTEGMLLLGWGSVSSQLTWELLEDQ